MPVKRNPEWPRLDPQALAAAREAAGMSRLTLSRALGASDRYIGRMEQGKFLPPTERVQQIAELLGVPIEKLLTTEE